MTTFTSLLTRPALLDSEEEALIRATVAKISERHAADRDVDSAWAALTQSGFTELCYPDENGLAYGDPQCAFIVAEEMARSLCGAPVVSAAILVPELLRLAGFDATSIAEFLDVGPVALLLAEDMHAISRFGSNGIAWDAGPCRRALSLLDDELCVVPLGEPAETADLTRVARRGVGTPERLGAVIGGSDLNRLEQFGSLAIVADSIGVAEALFDLSIDYVKERVQFGVPVGSFQAVQHICADAYVQLEALRSALAYAGWAFAGQGDDAEHAVRVAKAYSNHVAIAIVNAATQAFGGIAITWEHDAHRSLRRVVTNRVLFGDNNFVLQALGTGTGV